MSPNAPSTHRHPRLTEPEIRRLIALAQAGGPGARAAQEALVRDTIPLVAALARRHARPPFRDAIQDGLIAALAAIDGFDLAHGSLFGSFAATCVRRAIGRGEVIRRKYESKTASLAPAAEGDPDPLEALADPASPDPEKLALYAEVCRAVERLPAGQREVIRRRYWGQETLQEIGAVSGRTRERIRQIEAGALAQIRWALTSTSA